MTMTLEQAFDALNDTTVRLQNVAAECSNDDTADAMREKARVHARAVATVKAHLAQPAQSVDVEKVREVIENIRDDQRLGIATADEVDIADKLTAALQEKGNGA